MRNPGNSWDNMGMPYSEMFTDSAERRARILEEVAERYRRIRLEEFAALELLAELRNEPDKVMAELPIRISVEEREQVEAALMEQAPPAPTDDREAAGPGA